MKYLIMAMLLMIWCSRSLMACIIVTFGINTFNEQHAWSAY